MVSLSMRHPLRWIAFGIYVWSLFLPAFSDSDLLGLHLTLFGVVGILEFQPLYGLPWLANLFFIGSYLFRFRGWRRGFIILAVLLASVGFFITAMPGPGEDEFIPVHRMPGFYLWYAAYVLLLIDNILGRRGGWPFSKSEGLVEDEDDE